MPRMTRPCWMICLAVLWSQAGSAARADDPPANDWDQATACFGKQDYAGAVRHLDAMIAAKAPAEIAEPATRRSVQFRWRYSHLGAIYQTRADALTYQGKWAAALADCTVALDLGVADPDLRRIEGYCHLGLGEYDPAIAAFNALTAAEPREIHGYYGRAMARLMLRRYDEALGDLDELQSIALSTAALQVQAAIRMSRYEHDLALADLDEAVRVAPQNPAVLTQRASARMYAGQFDAARLDADEAIRLDPRNAAAYGNRAMVALHQRRHADAIADTDEAIRLDPSRAGNYYENRAQVRWEQRDAAGALADLDLAARTRPDDPKLAAIRARFLATAADAQHRDGPAALALASQAVERTKRADPAALTALAEAHAALGDFPRAVEAAEAASKLPPADPVEWRIDGTSGTTLNVSFWFTDHDPARTRRDLEAALARYRAGKP